MDGDDLATVVAPDYITNASDLDMRVGDVVHVYDFNTPLVSICWVSAISPAGAATLTNTV